MATPTYDNGLYQPWQPASDDAGSDWQATSAAWQEATTSTAAPTWDSWSESTTSPAAAWATTTTTPAWVASSPTTSAAAWSSSAAVTSSSTTITTTTTTTTTPATSSTARTTSSSLMTSPRAAIVSSSSSSSASSTPTSVSSSSSTSTLAATTVSRYSNPTGTNVSVIAAGGNGGGSGSFKMVYLVPAFVIVPLVAVFAILACTYGKCWAKARSKSPLPGSHAESSAWWGGAVGSWRRGMHDPDDDDEELGGLVREKSRAPAGASAYEYDEKRFSLPSNRGGSRWTSVFSIASRSAAPYQQPAHEASIPFLSVSQAPADQPFVPPSRSSSTHDFPRWTAQDPYAPNRAPPVNNGLLSAGVWRMGSQSRRYNPRMTSVPEGANLQRGLSTRSTDTFGSRLSDKIFKRFPPGAAAADNCPSPSVYSPSPESGPHSFGAVGTYMGLQGVDEDEDEDDFLDEKKHADRDYDAFLAEARVRDGGLAKRYVAGEVTEADLGPQQASSIDYGYGGQADARLGYLARHGQHPSDPFARPATPPFDVNLPSAPTRLQVSPKKTASTLVRAAAPDTPERETGSRNLLFSYASPPVNPSSPRPPLPPVPSQYVSGTRASSPTKGPLTDVPTKSAFRQQAPPQLAKPARPNDPFASIAVQPNRHSVETDRPLSVGSPMPAYEPPAARKSEMSAFSLDAYGALAYSDAEEPAHSKTEMRPSSSTQRSATMKAQRPTSQQVKQDGRSGVTGKGATKPRPKSAYANLASQGGSRPRLPTRDDLRPVAGSRGDSGHLNGFEPVFPDSPDLKPLQHPNRVRAAVENLESSRSGPSAKAQHRKTDSHDSGRTTSTLNSSLARSATAGPSVGYRRPLGNKGLDSDEEGNSSDDSEAIKINRRLSRLILNRSRSQTQMATSPDLDDNDNELSRPLSRNPERLSSMLRRPIQGGGLGGPAE
ncbi:hypothetical protein JCM3774_000308 [Rhodotorula dairenensis]